MIDIKRIQTIKELVTAALFRDDYFLDLFVLKGGNAMELVYGVSDRPSMDIDVSMPVDFSDAELEEIQKRLDKSFEKTFAPEGYIVFDTKFEKTPKEVSKEFKNFWGGYTYSFKLITSKKRDEVLERWNHLSREEQIEKLRRNAEVVNSNNGKTFKVDISSFEYCDPKIPFDLPDGVTIFVYSPAMLVYEKLRAICQQTEEYVTQLKRKVRKHRARDFYDIHSMITRIPIAREQLLTMENLKILVEIFKAKQVDLFLLDRLEEERDFHRVDWPSVVDDVGADKELAGYDYYFDFVKNLAEDIMRILKAYYTVEEIAAWKIETGQS